MVGVEDGRDIKTQYVGQDAFTYLEDCLSSIPQLKLGHTMDYIPEI